MRVYLATDHSGFELKEHLKKVLTEKGYTVEDCGAYTYDKDDDYPDFIAKASEMVSKNTNDRAIVIGGSGEAEAMAANKFPNVRAALFYSPQAPPQEADVTGRKSNDPYEIVRLSRQHNNANVLSLGARFLSMDEAAEAVEIWLKEPFSEDPRHVRRIEKIKKIEQELRQ